MDQTQTTVQNEEVITKRIAAEIQLMEINQRKVLSIVTMGLCGVGLVSSLFSDILTKLFLIGALVMPLLLFKKDQEMIKYLKDKYRLGFSFGFNKRY